MRAISRRIKARAFYPHSWRLNPQRPKLTLHHRPNLVDAARLAELIEIDGSRCALVIDVRGHLDRVFRAHPFPWAKRGAALGDVEHARDRRTAICASRSLDRRGDE